LAAAEAPAAEEPRIHLPLLVAPDRILFTRAGLDSGVEHSALFVMNGDGSTVRQLTTSQLWVSQAVWSPQGNQILFASREASSIVSGGALNVMNADGSGVMQLTGGEGETDMQPQWRP
jgi:TolB protein